MIDKLRRHIAFLALALLGWMVWGTLNPDTGEKKAEAKVVLHEIDPGVLAIRPADEAFPPVTDVFRVAKAAGKAAEQQASGGDAARTVAQPVAAADPTETAAAWVASMRVLGRDLVQAVGAWGEPDPAAIGAAAAGGAPIAAAPPASRPFEMVLQSTLALAGGGQARISGQTASVGESLVWLDPVDPPVLAAVLGTTATVVRGQDSWVLDLQGNAHVSVGGPLAAAALDEGEARAAAAANPRTARPPRAQAASGAAAGASRAPAAAPVKKKGTYKARGYPGKPK